MRSLTPDAKAGHFREGGMAGNQAAQKGGTRAL
jgi:hypothetical protein